MKVNVTSVGRREVCLTSPGETFKSFSCCWRGAVVVMYLKKGRGVLQLLFCFLCFIKDAQTVETLHKKVFKEGHLHKTVTTNG